MARITFGLRRPGSNFQTPQLPLQSPGAMGPAPSPINVDPSARTATTSSQNFQNSVLRNNALKGINMRAAATNVATKQRLIGEARANPSYQLPMAATPAGPPAPSMATARAVMPDGRVIEKQYPRPNGAYGVDQPTLDDINRRADQASFIQRHNEAADLYTLPMMGPNYYQNQGLAQDASARADVATGAEAALKGTEGTLNTARAGNVQANTDLVIPQMAGQIAAGTEQTRQRTTNEAMLLPGQIDQQQLANDRYGQMTPPTVRAANEGVDNAKEQIAGYKGLVDEAAKINRMRDAGTGGGQQYRYVPKSYADLTSTYEDLKARQGQQAADTWFSQVTGTPGGAASPAATTQPTAPAQPGGLQTLPFDPRTAGGKLDGQPLDPRQSAGQGDLAPLRAGPPKPTAAPTSPDYTQADLEHTAQKYGITVDEVKRRLQSQG